MKRRDFLKAIAASAAAVTIAPALPLPEPPKVYTPRIHTGANRRPNWTSRESAEFKRISIPLVRRIYPQLIANKIVSVQPLLAPTGLVYYLRFRYSENRGTPRTFWGKVRDWFSPKRKVCNANSSRRRIHTAAPLPGITSSDSPSNRKHWFRK